MTPPAHDRLADLERRLADYVADEPPAPPARRAAVAAILRHGADGHEVLLMTRVLHERDPWSGHVSLPGGTQEPDDADLLATARRETREEVGLDLDVEGRLLTALTPVTAVARGGPLPMDITPFVFRLPAPEPPRLAPGPEAAEAFWLPLELAASGALDGEHVWIDRRGTERTAVRRVLPAWHYEGRVIWGLTWRMLRDLLAAAGRA